MPTANTAKLAWIGNDWRRGGAANLDRAGLVNVPIEEVPGQLSDHYDPD